MTSTKHFNFLDANTTVGRHMHFDGKSPHSVADLLDEMDHYGVAESLVIDCLSRECHPTMGNARIIDETRDSARLHPIWSALPHGAADEQVDSETLVAQMRDNNVGLLTLFPRQYRFTFDQWCIDDFIAPIADAGIPIMIDSAEIGPGGHGNDCTDWPGVVALCKRFPNLPVIISERRIRRTQRLLYRAFEACDNLHLELSCYWLHRGIEQLTERFGAHRLIYGSNWPYFGPHMTFTTLTTAEISDDDKRLIAGDNMRRLMSWCDINHESFTPDEPRDEFVKFARTGDRPADMTFADNHGHIGGKFSHYHVPEPDRIVEDMDRLGVEYTCVFAYSGITSDERPGNDITAEWCAKYPDKFVGFTMLNPHRGKDMMLDELKRGRDMGLRGVKLIPTYQQYPEEGPNIDIACQWAHDNRQCILNHYWGGVDQMRRLVSTYSDACFFTGHTTVQYADIMREHANLYVCSCPLVPPRACENVVDAIGADRFMFGSDLQDLPIAWGLGPILCSRVTPDEKRLILGGNLRRVLQTYSQPVTANV